MKRADQLDWRFSAGGTVLYAVAISLGITLTPEAWSSFTAAVQIAYLCLFFAAAGISLGSIGVIRKHALGSRIDKVLFTTGWFVAIAGFIEYALVGLDANYAGAACPGDAALGTIGRCQMTGPFTVAEYALLIGLAIPIMTVVGLYANKLMRLRSL